MTSFVTVSTNQGSTPIHVNQYGTALSGTGDYIIVLASANNASPTLTVTNSGTGGGIVTDTFRMTASGVIVPHISTPSAPGASRMILYAKSDNLPYQRSGAAGVETPILSLAHGAALALLRINSGATGFEYGSAGQIVFPATQNPSANANTLDDYEEGTWIPSNGATSYVVQTGTYTKIGNFVFIRFTLGVSTMGAGSATLISGLPFATAVNSSFPIGYWDTSATNIVFLSALVSASSLVLYSATVAQASLINNPIMQFGTNILGAGGYEV